MGKRRTEKTELAMTRTTSTLQSASALGEFAAFATRLAPAANLTAPRPRRRIATSLQPVSSSAVGRKSAPAPSTATDRRRPAFAPPTQSTGRQQAELDSVVRALDELLAAPPDGHFDTTLLALNARIDAVDLNTNTVSSSAASSAPVHVCPAPSHISARSLPRPRPVARSRPKLTGEGDYEPLNFNVAHWRAKRSAPEPTDFQPQIAATAPASAAPQSDLSDDCLRDLIELSQDGIRVDWPQGLDVHVAQAVLRSRLTSNRSIRSAPLQPVHASDMTMTDPHDPCSLNMSTVPAVLPMQPSCTGSHPPGMYPFRVSPDGATKEIHSRRIVDGTPSCIDEQSEVPFSSSSTSLVHHPPGLYTSEVSPDGAPRAIQTRRIEVTNCTAQSSTSFSSSKVGPLLATPCTEQASSPRPEPARAGGARRKPMTRQDEESACAAVPPVPALAANLPEKALDEVHSASRPFREPRAEQLSPRVANQGEHSSLLVSAARAGSVPVRGSAGVFGKKNQR